MIDQSHRSTMGLLTEVRYSSRDNQNADPEKTDRMVARGCLRSCRHIFDLDHFGFYFAGIWPAGQNSTRRRSEACHHDTERDSGNVHPQRLCIHHRACRMHVAGQGKVGLSGHCSRSFHNPFNDRQVRDTYWPLTSGASYGPGCRIVFYFYLRLSWERLDEKMGRPPVNGCYTAKVNRSDQRMTGI